jgi:DNA-binding protein HU-beta
MNKSQLIDSIAAHADVSKAIAERTLNAFMTTVKRELIVGDSVELTGFGKFEVTQRAAREGRNPQTGETIQIAAAKSVKFKPGKGLKEAVNI